MIFHIYYLIYILCFSIFFLSYNNRVTLLDWIDGDRNTDSGWNRYSVFDSDYVAYDDIFFQIENDIYGHNP